MPVILSTLVAQFGLKILTESVLKRVVVLTLWKLAQASKDTDIDDELVKAVADALGVPLPAAALKMAQAGSSAEVDKTTKAP